jgi:hypothetical protein
MTANALTTKLLEKMDADWRAANDLSVRQIGLKEQGSTTKWSDNSATGPV